ncbi:nucleotide exchange factor GrpE [bacterium]|nr:nucleotide exchange factor GrpE [bacterium]
MDEKLKTDINNEEQEAKTPEISNEIIDMLKKENDSIRKENESLKEEFAKLKDGYVRVAADFENLKKRTKKEIDDIKKYGISSLLKDTLPAIDNLLRAIEHSKSSSDFQALSDGIDLVYRQFLGVLESYNVKPFDSMGTLFDPSKHEALQIMPNNEVDDNTVIIEYEKGYYIGDRLLRPAKVIVSKRTEAPKEMPVEETTLLDENETEQSKIDVEA